MPNPQDSQSDEELYNKIRMVVLGTTPDEFFSDRMLRKPGLILQLILADRQSHEAEIVRCLHKLQTYVFYEGSKEKMVMLDDVVSLLTNQSKPINKEQK